jgi:4-carboxymuconolactone decarboxylase
MEKVTDAQYHPASARTAGPAAPSDARKAFGAIAPALATYTGEVLFGDVWKRRGLSPRGRSTVITHLAFYSGWPAANSALPIARRVFQEPRDTRHNEPKLTRTSDIRQASSIWEPLMQGSKHSTGPDHSK